MKSENTPRRKTEGLTPVQVAFVDFWQRIDLDNFILMKALRQHHEVVLCDMAEADYVFYSVFGDEHWFAPDRAVKIFYTGENCIPDFNACDYAFGFNHITMGDRYMRLPNYYCTPRFLKSTLLMEQKHILPAGFDVQRDKPDFCSFVVSNGDAYPIRHIFFELLSKYRKVDSGGRYINNIGGPIDDKTTFDARHRFAITFENSSTPGYTTEKIVDAFAARCVPIYWGDPDVCSVFNPKAFVNVGDYDSLDEVVRRVIALDRDNESYLNMLREPALLDNAYQYESIFNQVVSMIDNITSMPLSEAYRYNRDFWGKKYIAREQRLILQSRKNWKMLLKETVKDKFHRHKS